MNKKKKAILKKMDNLIALLRSSKRWTQGDWAEDAKGHSVGSRSRKAVKFCLEGAMEHCRIKVETGPICEAIFTGIPEGMSIHRWNDWPDRKHSEVLKLLRDARKELKGTLNGHDKAPIPRSAT